MTRAGRIVLGLGYGDEGKGLVTDYLVSKATKPLVVRFSGGHQAGHTVILDGKRHVFSHFGSGTLRGAPTYWSRFCTAEPIGFRNEKSLLNDLRVHPDFYIAAQCPVTTPYDIAWVRSALNNVATTVGNGHGATRQREEDHLSLRFGDLYYPQVMRMKIWEIRDYYSRKGLDVSKVLLDDWYFAVEKMTSGAITLENPGFENYDLIFEGSQGLLLDQNYGFYPHTTWSNTGIKNALELDMFDEYEVWLVTRAYQTRHGSGPLTNTEIEYEFYNNPDETNKPHAYQGVQRRSVLDLDMIRYAIDRDGHKHEDFNLVITCMDQLERVKDNYKFVYTDGGRVEWSNRSDQFITQVGGRVGARGLYVSYGPSAVNVKEIWPGSDQLRQFSRRPLEATRR